MRHILILLVLISIGLTSPALAHGDRGDRHRQASRVEHNDRQYAHHERGQKYRHFRQRMHQLRKDLRHERHDNRRLRRRAARFERRLDRREARRERRLWRHSGPLVVYRQAYVPFIVPNILIRIPLNW